MSIGRGWFPEESTNQLPISNELVANLLRTKLAEVFQAIQDNPNRENLTVKGRYYG